ncbi:TetR/AcrR family transcriptional regulator [Ferrimicrobium sp.]|uniref:TetR/AcrR family transcriptional regulator n=1 Tax=Ferrimicrobium sp. TaxID=2926050 RepID=UPI0026288BBB|nr:TetR/AcrR family transcriptional regulator [Ferrimicrobium sp.]
MVDSLVPVRRQEIARLAVNRFALKGFDGTSMNDLAQHVGLSKAGIYHYFATKEAILFEALLGYSERLLSTVQCALEGGDTPSVQLSRVIEAVLYLYRDADAYHQAQINDLARLASSQQEIIRENERRVVRVMEGLLQQVGPELDASTIKALTMSTFGILNWHARWFREGSGKLGLSEYASLVTEFVVGGVANVVAQRTGERQP